MSESDVRVDDISFADEFPGSYYDILSYLNRASDEIKDARRAFGGHQRVTEISEEMFTGIVELENTVDYAIRMLRLMGSSQVYTGRR